MKIHFRQFRIALLLGLMLATFSAAVWAQDDNNDAPDETAQTAVPGDPALRNAYFNRLCAAGSYDIVNQETSALIDKAEQTDPPTAVEPMLLYWRGRAEYAIGWFGDAQTDLQKAQQGGVRIQGATPESLLAKIADILPLIPPQVAEIQNGGDVVFRVYYTQDDPITRMVLQYLPIAYRVNAAMFGADVIEQPVFIFNTFPQMQAFVSARGGRTTSWAWAAGSRDSFYFCLETPQREPVAQFREGYLTGTVVHEHNHCLFMRAMGNVDVPNWFIEGIAMCAAGQISPEDIQLNDYTIARLFEANALIAPQRLEDNSSFKSTTELGVSMDRGGAGIIAPSAYGQAYSMTRFLLANMRDGQLVEFLNHVREAKSFDKALQDDFGVTLTEFYTNWYAYASKHARG